MLEGERKYIFQWKCISFWKWTESFLQPLLSAVKFCVFTSSLKCAPIRVFREIYPLQCLSSIIRSDSGQTKLSVVLSVLTLVSECMCVSCFELCTRSLGFIFFCSKITVDGDCSHEIKRCLLLGSKTMTNLDSILKSRDIVLPTKVHLVKAMVFPVMYGCESWTIKKAEHRRIDAFEVLMEKTLESPLDCKEISPS